MFLQDSQKDPIQNVNNQCVLRNRLRNNSSITKMTKMLSDYNVQMSIDTQRLPNSKADHTNSNPNLKSNANSNADLTNRDPQ